MNRELDLIELGDRAMIQIDWQSLFGPVHVISWMRYYWKQSR